MKSVTGWWFAPKDNKLANGDSREIKIGVTHTVEGEIIPCKYGLHLSKRIINALQYAPGSIVYKVKGFGKIVPHGNPVDKYACSHREYILGGIDVSHTLRKFARFCALDVIHLWDAPNIVVKYLKTGNEKLRAAASAAAWDSARAAAWDSAWAADSAAWASAWSEASAAAWASASAAAVKKQNNRLTSMVLYELSTRRITPHRRED